MGFLDINLSDATEPVAVEGDKEYMIRLLGITQDIDKNGNPYILPRFDVPDEPHSKDFTNFYPLPREGMTEKELNNAKWRLKLFFDAFEIDYTSTIDYEEVVGRMAWAILGVKESDEYGDQNFIRKFVRAA